MEAHGNDLVRVVALLAAGAALIRGNVPKPTPFTTPRRAAEPLSEETAAVAETAKPG